MGNFRISVVMATYNSEKYIEQQLISLFSQTRLFDELIICDDCSNDNTLNIIKTITLKFKLNEKVKILLNEKNTGYISNFKKGIEQTTGNLIFLCDHDDIWETNKIEEVESVFQCNKNIKCLGHSFKTIDGFGNIKKTKRKFFWSNNGLIKRHIRPREIVKINFKEELYYNFCPGCCIAFCDELKEYLCEHISDMPHDYIISFFYSIKRGLYFYNTSLIRYRIHGSNAIGLPQTYSVESRLENARKDYLNKLELSNKFKKDMNRRQIRFSRKVVSLFFRRYIYLKNKNVFRLAILAFFKRVSFFLTILKDIEVLIKHD